MSIRSILAPLTSDTEWQIAALEAAIALASHRRACVDVLYMKAEPAAAFRGVTALTVTGGKTLAETYAAYEQQIRQQCAAMRQDFADLCKRFGVAVNPGTCPSATWQEADRDPAGELARRGRVSDLIVVGCAAPEGSRTLLELALRSTGRPVLLVPARSGAIPGRRIAIAWNGSIESARALAAALPLLETAQAVTILTARSDHTAPAVAEGARVLLARHDIAAKVRVFEKSLEPPVGRALLEHCREIEADLLVMGAYTHSRAHELLLGGVTSYMAAHADRAVFMMH